jgi:dihydrodipicolinate synthase/N-acetylneuraminate lyase
VWTGASVFKTEGGAYVQLVTEFDYAGSGPMSIVSSMTHLNFYAQAGADATLLGTTAESPKLNLNEVKKTKREPDIDACGAK